MSMMSDSYPLGRSLEVGGAISSLPWPLGAVAAALMRTSIRSSANFTFSHRSKHDHIHKEKLLLGVGLDDELVRHIPLHVLALVTHYIVGQMFRKDN